MKVCDKKNIPISLGLVGLLACFGIIVYLLFSQEESKSGC